MENIYDQSGNGWVPDVGVLPPGSDVGDGGPPDPDELADVISSGDPELDDAIQDLVAAMITGGSHTNITVTYDDATGKLSFSGSGGGAGGGATPTDTGIWSGTATRALGGSAGKLGEIISVLDFGADPTGVASSTVAFMAAHDYCYNSGTVRGEVYVPPGTYKITDTNADSIGLLWNDGVPLKGCGYSSKLSATTAITIIKWTHSGQWKKSGIESLVLDGGSTATVGLETVGGCSSYFADVLVQNCIRGFVIGATQNSVFSHCYANLCTRGWYVINGAGSNGFVLCGAYGMVTNHLEINNDAAFTSSYAMLGVDNMYLKPSFNWWLGGVYEVCNPANGTTIINVLKIVQSDASKFYGSVFANPTAVSDVLINIGASSGVSMTAFRDCYVFGWNGTGTLITQDGYNTVFDNLVGIEHDGDYISCSNFTHIIRPNLTIAAGKKAAKHSVNVYGEARDIKFEVINAGGGSANRPDATLCCGTVHYWNYDSGFEEIYDPIYLQWRTAGANLRPILATTTGGSPTYTPDARAGKLFIITLGANSTIAAPTNLVQGDELHFILEQDATGGRSVTWNAAYRTTWANTGNIASRRSAQQFVALSSVLLMATNAQAPYV